MKKLIVFIMTLVIVFSCTACKNAQKPELSVPEDISVNQTASSTEISDEKTNSGCKHVWKQWQVITEASCDKEGKKERVCVNCSKKQTETIKKLTHQESDWVIDKVAKVGKDGAKHKECIYCHKQLKTDIIPAIDENHKHNGAEWVVLRAASCTNEGKKAYICTCGFTIKTEVIKMKEHTVVKDKGTPATCISMGLSDGEHCSECLKILVGQKTLLAVAHDLVTEVVEPSLKARGYTFQYCKTCTYSAKSNIKEFEYADSSKVLFRSNYNGTCKVVGVSDSNLQNVVIPEKTAQGESVVEIYNSAFKSNNKIISVSIPSTVKKLGEFAFCACTNLTTVTGSQYVTTIEGSAFAECKSLKSLDISGAASLGNYICRDCKSLANVKLYDKLEKTPMCMFSGCTEKLNVNFPSNLKVIGNGTFWGASIESIVLPDSVVEIEKYAFRYCDNLKSITLPSNLETIGGLVFEQCHSLETITLPSKLKTISGGAFSFCDSLKEINIPDSVTTIGSECFSYCKKLTTVKLSNSLTRISYRMFTDCYSLKNVVLPSSIKSILGYAFYKTAIEEIVLPDGCTGVGDSAFNDCKNLKTVTVGENFSNISKHAFSGCSKLEKIVLPDQFKTLGYYAFANCTELKSVYLGKSIETMGAGAFNNCISLTSVFIPQSLANIKPAKSDESPFINCSGEMILYSDLPSGNKYWNDYFGRVVYNTTYSEYLNIIK